MALLPDCRCYKCTRARVLAQSHPEKLGGQPVELMRYFTCEVCGNKRCPHVADHELRCTNSNEPGQPGSLYA